MNHDSGARTYFASRPVRAAIPLAVPAPSSRQAAESRHGRPANGFDLGALLRELSPAPIDVRGRRPAPAAGVVAAVELLVCAYRVPGLSPGGYRYAPRLPALSRVRTVDVERLLRCAPLGLPTPPGLHDSVTVGPLPVPPVAVLAFVTTTAGLRAAHGPRGYRFALLDACPPVHAAMAAASALGYLVQPWPAASDSTIDAALGLDGANHSCQFLLSVSCSD